MAYGKGERQMGKKARVAACALRVEGEDLTRSDAEFDRELPVYGVRSRSNGDQETSNTPY